MGFAAVRVWSLFLLAAPMASPQRLSFGLKAGVPLNALMHSAAPGYRASNAHYTLGPTVELALPYRLAVEADLLYKRLDYGPAAGAVAEASRWELPLLAKYKLAGAPLQPFLGMGVTFNRITGIEGENIAEVRHRGTMGFCLGGGVEKRLGVLRVAPEIRITHWVDHNLGVHDAPLRSSLTQVEFLVGLTF